jgi:hypothetical protein
MRRRWLSLGIALTAVSGAACDPAFDFSGSVRDAQGRPVPGATVNIRCDPSFVQNWTRTGDGGAFHGTGIGWRPDDCAVEVVAAGYETATSPIGEHCAKRPRHLRTACLDVRFDATLVATAVREIR